MISPRGVFQMFIDAHAANRKPTHLWMRLDESIAEAWESASS